MNRKYTREHYLGLIEQIRTHIPHAAIQTDIIVGFPGETDADFQETVRLFEEVRFDGAFIFIGFSPNNQVVPADIRINQNGYVITDNKCETDVPGIFAIGDLREKYARQIITAAADGATAALAAAHYVENKKAAETCELPADFLAETAS